MKKIIRINIFLLVFLMAAAAGLWAITDQELLAGVDASASYLGVDFSAEYTIPIFSPRFLM